MGVLPPDMNRFKPLTGEGRVALENIIQDLRTTPLSDLAGIDHAIHLVLCHPERTAGENKIYGHTYRRELADKYFRTATIEDDDIIVPEDLPRQNGGPHYLAVIIKISSRDQKTAGLARQKVMEYAIRRRDDNIIIDPVLVSYAG